MGISALDAALWDLKTRLLAVPLFRLLGAARDVVPGYGSGGLTSYPVRQLQQQLGGWAEQGFRRVKMKIGRDPPADLMRVRAAREAVGPRWRGPTLAAAAWSGPNTRGRSGPVARARRAPVARGPKGPAATAALADPAQRR